MLSDTMTHNIKLSITTMLGGKSSIPDGSGLVKYPEPDIGSFIFDQKKGFLFDPTTGLHYDANSGFFINHELGILLRWDPIYSIFIRAGSLERLRPAMNMASSGGDLLKRERIHRSSSRSRSGSPVRQMLKLSRMRFDTRRSRSVSCGKQLKGRRSRSRSVGRGRKRFRSRSRSESTSKEPKNRRPRSSRISRRRPLCRSRSRSVSSCEQSRSRRPRSGSIIGRRQLYRSRSRSVGSSEQPKMRRPRYRIISDRRQICIRRSRSASDSEQPRSRGKQHHRSSSGDALRNDSLVRKSCSGSPSLQKRKHGRTPSPEYTNRLVEVEKNHLGETRVKTDVWNRLGPSPKRHISGAIDPSDSENGRLVSKNTRGVRLVHTYDGEASRSHHLIQDERRSSASSSDDRFVGVVDDVLTYSESNKETFVSQPTQKMGKSISTDGINKQEKEASYLKEVNPDDTSEVSSFEKSRKRKHMTRSDSRERNQLEANIGETKIISSRRPRSRSRVSPRTRGREPIIVHSPAARECHSRMSSEHCISLTRRSLCKETSCSHSEVVRRKRDTDHRSDSHSPRRRLKPEHWCHCDSCRRRNISHSSESRRSFSPSSVKIETRSRSGSAQGSNANNYYYEGPDRSHFREAQRKSYAQIQVDTSLNRKAPKSTTDSYPELSTASGSSVDVGEIEKSHFLNAKRVSERSSYREPHRNHNWRARSPGRMNGRSRDKESRKNYIPVAGSDIERAYPSLITKRSHSRQLRRSREREYRRRDSGSPRHVKKERLCYCGCCQRRCSSCSSECRRSHFKERDMSFSPSPSPTKQERGSRGVGIQESSQMTTSNGRKEHDGSLSRGTQRKSYGDIQLDASQQRNILGSTEKSSSYSSATHGTSINAGEIVPNLFHFSNNEDSSSKHDILILDNEPTCKTEVVDPKEDVLTELPLWDRRKSQCKGAINHDSSPLPDDCTVVVESKSTTISEAVDTRIRTREGPLVREIKMGQCHSANNRDYLSRPDESTITCSKRTPKPPNQEENIPKDLLVEVPKASQCHSKSNHDSSTFPDETTDIIHKDAIPTTICPGGKIQGDTPVYEMKIDQCHNVNHQDSSSPPEEPIIIILDNGPTPETRTSAEREQILEDATLSIVERGLRLCANNRKSSSKPGESTVILDYESAPETEAPDPEEKIYEESPIHVTETSRCHSANSQRSAARPDEPAIICNEATPEAPNRKENVPKEAPIQDPKLSQYHSAKNQDSSSGPDETTGILDVEATPKTRGPREKIQGDIPVHDIEMDQCHNANNQDSSSPPEEPIIILDDEPTPKTRTSDQRAQIPEGATYQKIEGSLCLSVKNRNSYPKPDECTIILDDESGPETEAQGPKEENQSSLSPPNETTIMLDDEPAPDTEGPDLKVIIPGRTPVVSASDNGDVLGHLFIDCNQTLSNILLVAPVPLHNNSKNASTTLKNQIGEPKDLLKVYFSSQNTSGTSCHFMMISFKSANAAKQWYDSLNGFIVLRGDNGAMLKGYLHFLKKGNWNCKHCKSFNFFMQSVCSKCYRAKGNGFSPVTISEEPTVFVGIARLNSKFLSTKKVVDSLPPLDDFNILSIDMVNEPSGLSLGLCVFEVENAEEGSKLLEFFHRQERKAMHLIVNEKPKSPDEERLSLLFDKVKPSNILLVALIPLVTIPDIKFELSLLDIYLSMLLKEDGVPYEKITLHVDKNVGFPYSYALITLPDSERAAQWSKLRRKTFNSFTGQYQSIHSRTAKQRSAISLYFSGDNWECHGCNFLNFSLRSLCHHCLKHREPNRFGSISHSSTATRWLAVPVLASCSEEDEQIVADLRELLNEFILKKIEVLREPECPSLPLACVFEMQGNGESLRLKEYLNREGWFSVFVVMCKALDGLSSIDNSNVPDVMIVEAPPPECIDLTSEEIIRNSVNDSGQLLETPNTDHPPPEPLMNPVSQHDVPLSAEITLPSEALALVCDETPLECVDLTSETNPSQLEEKRENTRVPDATPPIVDQPTQVNPTSADDCSPNKEGTDSVIEPICGKIPSASIAADVDPTKNVGNTFKKRKNLRKRKAFCMLNMMNSSDVISVGPVPWLGENTQWLYALAFLNYGANYESVQFCRGDLFGVPYNYCLVYFTSLQLAKKWYNMERRGFIHLTNRSFPNVDLENFKPFKAFLNFSGRNWRCNCGKENFWKRSICYRCYKHRGQKVATLVPSSTPTKFLAIKLLKWYPVAELVSIFPKARCAICDVVTVKFISDPNVIKDKFGVYIFETRSMEGTITLHDYYKQSLMVQSLSFVVLKDDSAGVPIDLGLSRSPAVSSETDDISHNTSSRVVINGSGCNTNNGGLMDDGTADVLGKPKPDYEAIIWTSFFGFHLNKSPANVVMICLCLEYRELPDETRVQIQDSLNRVGVTAESIVYSFKGDVGSPFSYCLISFVSLDYAKMWFDACNGDTFQFEVSRPDDKKIPHRIQDCYSQKNLSNGDMSCSIKSKLHYSSPNWLCSCGTSNFPLRSVCHSCFKNKNKESGYSIPSATKFVGIKLTKYLETVDTSALYDVWQLGFNVSKINIGLDPAVPRDPYGIVIFEMQSVNEGIKFKQFLTDLSVSGSQKRGKKQCHYLISNLQAILKNSSGIIFFKCQS